MRSAELDRGSAMTPYGNAIQATFGEASDALTLWGTPVELRLAPQPLVVTLQESYRYSDARYKVGIDGCLGGLVARRSRFAAQADLVSLYKVLGRGA